MQALPERVFGILSNDTLLAIPFFTLMGAILERCGLAEDLLDGLGQLFGPVRGGLGYAVIVVGAILGAITGTVAASVIAMGLISLPVMMRYGYDMKFATGVIAASGTITQLIPPSLVLIVLADQLGRSVGDMYAGAWGPSLVQVLLFSLYVLLRQLRQAAVGARHPAESRTITGWPLVKSCLWGIIPSLVLIFLVLGTIFLGLATPTEGGAMGMVGAIVLAVLHRQEFSAARQDRRVGRAGRHHDHQRDRVHRPGGESLPAGSSPRRTASSTRCARRCSSSSTPALALVLWEAVAIAELRNLIRQASQSTMRITAMVIFILIGSTIFTLVFRGVDGDPWIEHLLLAPAGRRGRLPDLRQHLRLLPRLLPRLLRDRLHHRAAARAGGGEARHRPDLVRRAAVREHADLVHAPAVRLRPVLPARHRAEGGEELGDLLGRDSLGGAAAHHGRHRHRLPAAGHRVPRQGLDVDPSKIQIERPADGVQQRAGAPEEAAEPDRRRLQQRRRNKNPAAGGVCRAKRAQLFFAAGFSPAGRSWS